MFIAVQDEDENEDDAKEKRKRGKQQYPSCRQHYAYRIQQRVDDDNILVKGRKLFRQYCCDMYIKIEGLRLKFFVLINLKFVQKNMTHIKLRYKKVHKVVMLENQ
jgi:hypothetical protein